MKAVLFSIGSRGDIEPFLAVAELLKEHQWEVMCVFPEQFRATVEQMGLTFRGYSREFLEIMEGKDARNVMGGQGSLWSRFRSVAKIARKGYTLSREMLVLQDQIQKEENPDRILYHPKCPLSLIWGMVNEGKSIVLSPMPLGSHVIDHLSVTGTNNYGRALNRASFWVANFVRVLMLRNAAKRFLGNYPGISLSMKSIRQRMINEERTLYTISSSLFPKPAYWPEKADVIGYYERDKSKQWTPPTELNEFLEKHDKVIFISFGSMTNPNPIEKTELILQVLKKHPIAAIINASWGGLVEVENSPEHIYFTKDIPYDWLFPKLYAVIHHGGAGTTHMGLKYGCATLIIPHVIDQFYWNNTVSERNFGPNGPSIRKLSVDNFEEKLQELLNNKDYKNNAVKVSKVIKEESHRDKLYRIILGE